MEEDMKQEDVVEETVGEPVGEAIEEIIAEPIKGPPDLVIDQLAQEYRAVYKFDDVELRELFDKFWEENGEMISKQFDYKGKKLKGGRTDLPRAKKALEKNVGISKLYKQVFAKIIGDKIEEEVNKRVMVVNACTLHNFEIPDTQTLGVLSFYYWPEIQLDKDKLDLNLVARAKFDLEEHKAARLNQLRNMHAQYKIYDGEGITENQRVLIDIIAACNGEPYNEMTARGFWTEVKHIQYEEIKKEVLQHNSGDLFELDFENPIPGELHKELVHAHIKIYEVQDITLLDTDDAELFEISGFDSKLDFEERFNLEFEEAKMNALQYQAFNDIVTRILSLATRLDRIPFRWYDISIDSFMQRHIDQYKGDKAMAMQAVGAKDEIDMRDKFQSKLYQETVQQMAYDWYAKNFNCFPDPESMVTDLMTRINWVNPE